MAISLRERLGDWFRVVQLMKMSTGCSSAQLEAAWNNIGDHYMDRNQWQDTLHYTVLSTQFIFYEKCVKKKMCNIFICSEDFYLYNFSIQVL